MHVIIGGILVVSGLGCLGMVASAVNGSFEDVLPPSILLIAFLGLALIFAGIVVAV